MQKYILKQSFEDSLCPNSMEIHKGYERILEIITSTRDSWTGIDSATVLMTLYNNMKSLENDLKSSTHHLPTSQKIGLKWTVAMISMKSKSSTTRTGRKLQFDAKEPVGFDKTKVECYNSTKQGILQERCSQEEENRGRDGWNTESRWNRTVAKKEESKALVTVDGERIDWITHSKDDDDYALMANNNSGSEIQDNPHRTLKNKGIIDSGCSRHMTGNKAYLADHQDIKCGR
ncbi:hypothetical protein Tco_0951357 [Tanacetum coccineum]|uniref:Uncharacterized protein n=1 Tax=Tanacetum coccineum TaxID=301880 RepID=A0ABQ5DTY3_9ASTR